VVPHQLKSRGLMKFVHTRWSFLL